MTERPRRAAPHAARAHAGQTGKGGEALHLTHVVEVAHLVASHGGGEDEAVAALLHDVAQDTPATAQGIEAASGARVAALVRALTDRPGWARLPRPEGKRLQAAHLAGAAPEARRIEIAGQIGDLRDVARLPAGRTRAGAQDDAAGTAHVAVCAGAAPDLAALHARGMAAFEGRAP